MSQQIKLTEHQQDKLAAAVSAHHALESANENRIKAFRAAVNAGVPMATIADRIGMVRSSVWHILNRAKKKKA